MSTLERRSHSGTGNVAATKLSLIQLCTISGIPIPAQDKMRLMMRAIVVGLPWSAKEDEVLRAEGQKLVREKFRVFSLDEYKRLPKWQYGAPIPPLVDEHIAGLLRLPDVEVRIHAHPYDDPVVEVRRGEESLFTEAWERNCNNVDVLSQNRRDLFKITG